jgi:hypothetical protein
MDSLGLIGDLDELEFARAIEQAFGIAFTAEDYALMRTVGDIESAVWRHLQTRALKQNRCATASAFYELRRSLSNSDRCSKIAPTTPLAALGLSPRKISALVRSRSRMALRFPVTRLTTLGCLMVVTGLLLGTSLAVITNSGATFMAAVAFVASGLLAMQFDPRQFGPLQTVGDAARELVNWNFDAFLSRGARLNRAHVWHAIRVVAADFAGGRIDGIAPDTLIIRKRAKQRVHQHD